MAEEVETINIKKRTYYFFDDMINLNNFYSNLLKIDKMLCKDIDIYYTGYMTIKKSGDCEKIHSINRCI